MYSISDPSQISLHIHSNTFRLPIFKRIIIEKLLSVRAELTLDFIISPGSYSL